MTNEYIEQRNGGFYVSGSRVSLDSLVYAFLRGESPEAIQDSFPALRLEQVSGALAYYLENRAPIDRYLREGRQEFAVQREESRRNNPALYAKLDQARQRAQIPAG